MNRDKLETKSIEEIRHLCYLAGIDFAKFLGEMRAELKNRILYLLRPNLIWFREGKSFERYWRFLEQVTKHEWKYEDVAYWYKFIRDPSETREDIPPSLRYQVLVRDKSTCQKCGRKAPNVELQVDHVLPWDCGGPTVIDNLQTLCKECNLGKSNKCFEGDD
jgi:5-methylcytosine-specific restriction endonuclease McrA